MNCRDNMENMPLAADTSAATVLLVDDDLNVIHALVRLLRPTSARVLTASSGEQALEILAQQKVDVVVSDSLMLPVPGIELLRRARQIYPCVATILLSGKSSVEDIHQALRERIVDQYLPKPWDSGRLIEAVCAAFPPLPRTNAASMSEQEAVLCMSRLEGLFSCGELNLHAGEPQADTFAGRIGTAGFWRLRAEEIAEGDRYSPAARFYLQNYWGAPGQAGFEIDFRGWMGNFFAARRDQESTRDILILFLYLNLEYLKHLYILDQPRNRNLAPHGGALHTCLTAPENRALRFTPAFPEWVLEDWLPFQLRYFYDRERQAGIAASA